MDFKAFPKIYRVWEQKVTITEKIDGTNASITITEDGKFLTGSRNRFIVPGDDNYGFALWANENKQDLLRLGEGTHYGEWWGKGIQRGYGLDHKVFSLFNPAGAAAVPACCSVVPLIFHGKLMDYLAERSLTWVPEKSIAAAKFGSEFDRVEGLMFYFHNSELYMKQLVELGPKGVAA